MSKLQDRENKRKSIIGGMIDAPTVPAASTRSRGRPEGGSGAEEADQPVGAAEFVR